MSDVGAITFEGSTAVTLSDTLNDPAGPFIGFIVGAAGAISFVDGAGNVVTWPSVVAGSIYPIHVARVRATGTTATGIFGMKGPQTPL